jgi:hypothetical protein
MAYRVTFVVDLFKGPEEQELSHNALLLLLDTLTQININFLKAHPETPNLYDAGVRYQEEPPGREDWQDIPSTLALKNGDCEDLSCWRAAELRVRHGIAAKPTFIWKMRPSGGYLYHIQVEYPDGRIEDPSRRLGMK